ncbi:hypothetical protein [Actinomadura sp. K4S16]|uniref:hypothetical protein n=1 Tax=Actinomadura sp. K4S16 TaxID=1316147 RepID=UPI0011EC258B|nr:hypothetical protein [Actinomadura sp. K4S16]
MLLYRASLPLSRRTLTYATGVVRRHRQAIGSKGRRLPAGMQALMTLVHLRKGETCAEAALPAIRPPAAAPGAVTTNARRVG